MSHSAKKHSWLHLHCSPLHLPCTQGSPAPPHSPSSLDCFDCSVRSHSASPKALLNEIQTAADHVIGSLFLLNSTTLTSFRQCVAETEVTEVASERSMTQFKAAVSISRTIYLFAFFQTILPFSARGGKTRTRVMSGRRNRDITFFFCLLHSIYLSFFFPRGGEKGRRYI